MNIKYEEAKKIVNKYRQEHLLLFYNKLSEENKKKLLNQIISINFEQMNTLYNNSIIKSSPKQDIIKPIPYMEKDKIDPRSLEEYKNEGIKEIKLNKVASVTMAGGQGTRLGHDGPKGTYKLNVSNESKSLFEILCEDLKRIKKKYGVIIPWYIMTSKENNKDTIEFFNKNNYFNYPKESIIFFEQGKLPMLDFNGKVLIDEDGLIKEAADGHGGIFEAMFKNKVVEDMKNRGIEWVFVGPIDNPLIKMVDEVLIGITKNSKALGAGKSLVKSNSKEKVGVFCIKNEKPSVIEYTEITEEMANEKDKEGNLLYGESHINCNMFNIKGIEKIGNSKLPYHTAIKKASYLDSNGKIIKPEEPNSYKFESFIFDAFNKLDNMVIVRVKRDEEFAPVKNREGTDSVETAIELYNSYYKKQM